MQLHIAFLGTDSNVSLLVCVLPPDILTCFGCEEALLDFECVALLLGCLGDALYLLFRISAFSICLCVLALSARTSLIFLTYCARALQTA